MDGTIVDSMDYWKNLSIEFLNSKGIYDIPEYIIEKIKSMTISESAKLFASEFSLEDSSSNIAEEINELMDSHYYKDIPLKKGVYEYIENLNKKGVTMCVASATDETLMKACLSRLGIIKYFKFLISCESVGVGKSQPDVYFEAERLLGCSHSEVAVYEDAFYAIETAKKAGFYVVGVYDESSDEHWDKIKEISDETIYSF